MKKTKKPEKHLECGGSAAHRWPRCSGSIYLGRKAPKTPPGKAALRGTDTHELVATCISDFLDHKLLGTDPEKKYKEAKAFRDEQQIRDTEFCRDYIWNEVLENSVTNKAWAIEEFLIHAECKKMGGTADFWCAHINDKGQRVLHVVDYKNGVDPVPATHEQIPCYGSCIRSQLRKKGKDIDRLIGHIVQPNSLDGKKVKVKAYTPKQLDAKEEWFKKALHRIYVEKKCQFKVGYWCKWCPGWGICEKYAEKKEKDTGLSLLTFEKTKLPDISSLSEEQVVALALHKQDLIDLCKACTAVVIGQHTAGNPYPGCKVVTNNPNRRIPAKNKPKLEKKLKKKGFDDDEIYKKSLRGIGDLEKLLGPKKKLLEKYIERGKPTASVVPEDDPREAAADITDLLVD